MISFHGAGIPGLGATGRPEAADLAANIWGTGERQERGGAVGCRKRKRCKAVNIEYLPAFRTTSKPTGLGHHLPEGCHPARPAGHAPTCYHCQWLNSKTRQTRKKSILSCGLSVA